MKTSAYLFLNICLAIILTSCSPEKDSEPSDSSSIRFVSESYQAPIFTNDDRVEQIQSIGPEIQSLIEEYAKTRNIPGISYGIVVDDELVLASATGLMNLEAESAVTPSSCFRIASMTKSFTAMAILKLCDEGKLSLSDPVGKYIPEMFDLEYLSDDAQLVDIENLLTMTAGFPEDNPWADRQLDESDEMLTDLISQGLSFSNNPSFEYEYSNTGFALLGNIVSSVSGVSYQEYITENILLPLGMTSTYWEYDNVPDGQLAIGYRWEDDQWKLEPMLHDGAFGAIGGLITSIEDFSKYVSFHLSAWPTRSGYDTGPIKRSTIREMHTPQFTRLYANARNYMGEPCASMGGYGYGLGITKNCDGLKWVSHGGALPGFGSNYVFYPDYGIGIMAFCNLTYTSPWPLSEIAKLLFETLSLEPRKLPISSILIERQEQVAELIQNWHPDMEERILAENFYLDKSREYWMAEIKRVLDKAGAINGMDKINPDNQLRGGFKLKAEHGDIVIYFSLSPESNPKVQSLELEFRKTKLKY
ncbi:MAG: beta-lactamase family protein [Bacteroidales bacterium]|nr:beta-lactamase family protein [Bacteroidales bacterium]